MGIALWTACALVLFAAARFVPAGRPTRWIGELIAALTSAMLFGLLATFLDFGGWNEPDWRAGVFVFLGAAAVIAILRVARLTRSAGSRREPDVIGSNASPTPRHS